MSDDHMNIGDELIDLMRGFVGGVFLFIFVAATSYGAAYTYGMMQNVGVTTE